VGTFLRRSVEMNVTQEPTSGLDSAIAHSLMSTLVDYSRTSRKVVVSTIHQPSSQIFRLFTNLLLLVDGQVASESHCLSVEVP